MIKIKEFSMSGRFNQSRVMWCMPQSLSRTISHTSPWVVEFLRFETLKEFLHVHRRNIHQNQKDCATKEGSTFIQCWNLQMWVQGVLARLLCLLSPSAKNTGRFQMHHSQLELMVTRFNNSLIYYPWLSVINFQAAREQSWYSRQSS